MWRSALAGGLIFILTAILWVAWDPLLALRDVGHLNATADDWQAARERLLERGRGSLRPLRGGLTSTDTTQRLRCAQTLALLGEDDHDQLLVEALNSTSKDDAHLATELLRELWNRRNGPPPDRILTLLSADARNAKLNEPLDLCLTQYYTWAGGYVARAERHLTQEDPRPALRDALSALLLEPEHFDALVLLGRIYEKLGFPELAVDCLRHATGINPQLKAELAEDLTRLQAAAQKAHEKRLRSRYMDFPLL